MTKMVFGGEENPQKTEQVHSEIDPFLVGVPNQKVTLRFHLKSVRGAVALVDALADCRPLQLLGG
jgi:hypothetical protein